MPPRSGHRRRSDGGRRRLGRLSPPRSSRVGRARFPLAAPAGPSRCPGRQPEPELGVALRHRVVAPIPGPAGPGHGARQRDPTAGPRGRLTRSSAATKGLAGLDGPVIFAANHASHVDTPLLLSCLPLRFRHRTVVAAAADYFFDRRWKADTWSFLLAAIPFERNKVNRRSADTGRRLLADGWNLVIFPEGGVRPTVGARTSPAGPPTWLPHRGDRGAGAPGGHPPHPSQGRQAAFGGPGPRSPSAPR